MQTRPPRYRLHGVALLEHLGSTAVRTSRVTISLIGCSLALVAFSACRSDGRVLRPALPSQNGSVFTASTTTTIVDDAAQPTSVTGLPGAVLPGADLPVASNDVPVAGLTFALRTPWADRGVIDNRYTCNGENHSPPFSWLGAPAGAVEIALVVTDTDANDFVHWVIAGLDPKNPSVAEGNVPVGAIEGTNGFSTAAAPSLGWNGPCPPKGSTHHYRFTLYALDQHVELPTGSPASDLINVIDLSSIEASQVTGVYTSP